MAAGVLCAAGKSYASASPHCLQRGGGAPSWAVTPGPLRQRVPITHFRGPVHPRSILKQAQRSRVTSCLYWRSGCVRIVSLPQKVGPAAGGAWETPPARRPVRGDKAAAYTEGK